MSFLSCYVDDTNTFGPGKSSGITLSRITFESGINVSHGQLHCDGNFKTNNLQAYNKSNQQTISILVFIMDVIKRVVRVLYISLMFKQKA